MLPAALLFSVMSAQTRGCDAKTSVICSCIEDLRDEHPRDRHPRYFLGSVDCGTDTLFNPLTVLVNNALDITRQPVYPSRPADLSWGTGFRGVFNSLAHPDRVIRESGGWDSFLSHEVFPYRGIGGGRVQWLPNYVLHLIGEGMLYRKLSEWYEANGFVAPRAFGLATSISALLLNEAAENDGYTGPNRDPIADVYIFNPLGYLLFSFDAVAALFGDVLELEYWPGQAVVGANNGRVVNHGENYAFKIPLGSWTKARFFVHASNHALFGVSLPLDRGDQLSIAGGIGYGLAARAEGAGRVVQQDGKRNYELGLFWERDRSLLGSLGIGGPEAPFLRLNLYPGFLRFENALVGMYLIASRAEGVAAGITLAPLPLMPTWIFPVASRKSTTL